MRSPKVTGLGTDALRQSKLTSRQADACLPTNDPQTTMPIRTRRWATTFS
jgi:hypothetical protein